MDGWANTDRSAERPYPASPQRIQDAARQGRTPRSADLVSALAGLAGLLAVAWLGERMVGQLTSAFGQLLDGRSSPLANPFTPGEAAWAAAAPLVTTAGILALTVLAAASAAGILQGAWRIVLGNACPDWNRLAVGDGLRRMFSRRAWMRLVWALLKLAAVAAVAVFAILDSLPEACRLAARDPGGMLRLAGGLAWGLGLRVMAAICLLAAADYLYQRWQHRHDLRMTRREFLEDLKREEGDPAMRRRRQRRAEGRAAAQPARLAHASALVVGEGGRAVALQSFPGMRASRVVARAERLGGRRMREAAADFHIPVLDNPQLAEILFARCSVGAVVPRKVHREVAEFLAASGVRHQGKAALEGS